MNDDNEDRKDFDDGKPDPQKMLEAAGQMMRSMVPTPGIAFTMKRAELEAHLRDRADYHRTEAAMLTEDPKQSDDYKRLNMMDPIDAEEIRKTMIEGHRAIARRFDFMASHLAPGECFALALYDFETYELVPVPPTFRLRMVRPAIAEHGLGRVLE
jgi:hypothetical protein